MPLCLPVDLLYLRRPWTWTGHKDGERERMGLLSNELWLMVSKSRPAATRHVEINREKKKRKTQHACTKIQRESGCLCSIWGWIIKLNECGESPLPFFFLFFFQAEKMPPTFLSMTEKLKWKSSDVQRRTQVDVFFFRSVTMTGLFSDALRDVRY